jgi:mRNA interferase MazF
MLKPGDVVIADFVGATGVKRRPALVVSSELFNSKRPDVVLSALTTQTSRATAPTDYVLQDWSAAGLRQPSAFRVFVGMYDATRVNPVGHLSERDWNEVQSRLRMALALS